MYSSVTIPLSRSCLQWKRKHIIETSCVWNYAPDIKENVYQKRDTLQIALVDYISTTLELYIHSYPSTFTQILSEI